MTDRSKSRDGTRRRRHPAAASRILATGLSAATMLGLTAGWTATAAPATDGSADVQVVHAVITDPRIDPDLARRAAAAAAAAGRTTAQVTVEPRSDAAATADTPPREQTPAASAAPDVTTRAS